MVTRTWLGVCLLLLTASTASVRAERNLVRPPGTTRYAGLVRQLRALKDYDQTQGWHRLTLENIGHSVEGREIWMVTLHDPNVAEPGKKVFYLCRQHGHEPASTEAALHFIDTLVHADPGSDLADCLKQVTAYIVPMANPDGAERYLRHNAHDVDINRDWLKRTQPETQALWAAISRIRPDIMTDEHELYPNDYRPDFTETAGPKAGAPESTTITCETMQTVVHLSLAASGFPNRSYAIDSNHAPRLAHLFGCIVAGIPTILFETNRSNPRRTVAMRAAAHEQFMRIVMREAAGEQQTLLSDAYAILNMPASQRPTGPPTDRVGTPSGGTTGHQPAGSGETEGQ
jgi:hypothetical protein